jgi:hypothetical protein
MVRYENMHSWRDDDLRNAMKNIHRTMVPRSRGLLCVQTFSDSSPRSTHLLRAQKASKDQIK